jgi:hypothetical protein
LRHPPSHSVVITLTMVVALAGCSSGGGGGSETRRGDLGRSAERTSTTAAPTRIDLSEPIPGGSLHGTPRPPLENTGDDYIAVLTSLVANFRWLTENPDPTLISELYVPGTGDHDGHVATFNELVANQWRAADDGYYLASVEVIDTEAGAVSLRVVDVMDFERIVDASGAQVGEGRARSPKTKTWNVLLSSDTGGRWLVADWSPAEGGTVML